MVMVYYIFSDNFFLATGCKEKEEEIPVPTGKGKIYGELNERKMMCRIVKVIHIRIRRWLAMCIYKHPKSDIFDRVTVGEHNMCSTIYTATKDENICII